MYSVSYSIVEVSRLYETVPLVSAFKDDHPGLLDESDIQLLDEDGNHIEDENSET